MLSKKLGALLLATAGLFSHGASAVEFSECTKFLQYDKYKYQQCAHFSFVEAARKSEYSKITQWLNANQNHARDMNHSLLSSLMCGTDKGQQRFKTSDRPQILKVTDQLLRLGASFEIMPQGRIVTPLFCVVNRQDSVLLDTVLTRIGGNRRLLDASLYEGMDPHHVPLYRAVMNKDLASAKVLLKHGATVDFSVLDHDTALKKALQLGHADIANWLLDNGASVQIRYGADGCVGKSALDYALTMPTSPSARDAIIKRIQTLEQRTADAYVTRCANAL